MERIESEDFKQSLKDISKRIKFMREYSDKNSIEFFIALAKYMFESKIMPSRLEKKVMPDMPINDYILGCNENYMDDYAMGYGSNNITFDETFKKIDEIARGFIQMGVKPGDYVTVSLPTSPEAAYVPLALLKIGAITHEVDSYANGIALRDYVTKTKSKFIVINEHNYEKVKEIQSKTNIEKIITTSTKDSLTPGKTFEEEFPFISKDFEYYPLENFNPNDPDCISLNDLIEIGKDYHESISTVYKNDMPAVKIQTGGTTGVSKGALISSENILSIPFKYGLTSPMPLRGMNYLDFVPKYIITGFASGLILQLCMGWKLQMVPTYEVSKITDMVNFYKPNIGMGAPAYFVEMGESIEKGYIKDLSSYFLMVSAGDKMNFATQKYLSELFKTVGFSFGLAQGFGCSEATSLATTSDPMNIVIGSAGKAVPQTPVVILDPDTKKEVAPYQKGKIYIGGKGIMLGYDNEEENKKAFYYDKDGNKFFDTQDWGVKDKKGNIFHRGRIKNMICRCGYNIYPAALEDIISTVDEIATCKVVGKESEKMGEEPVAHIELKTQYQGMEDEVEQKIKLALENSSISAYCHPVSYIFWTSIPTIHKTGKYDFSKMKEISNANDGIAKVLIKNK